METHVKVLAVLYIVLSALGTLAAFVIATVFSVAGVANVISSRPFLPSTLNVGPAWMTWVSPSSLKQNTLPL